MITTFKRFHTLAVAFAFGTAAHLAWAAPHAVTPAAPVAANDVVMHRPEVHRATRYLSNMDVQTSVWLKIYTEAMFLPHAAS